MIRERLQIVGDDAPQQISEDLATLHDSVRRALLAAAEEAVEAALADSPLNGGSLHLRAYEVDVVIRRLVFAGDQAPTVPTSSRTRGCALDDWPSGRIG